MDQKNDDKQREYQRNYRNEKYKNDPVFRERHLKRIRAAYAKGREEILREREQNPVPDAVDIMLEVHDNELCEDPDRLSPDFLLSLIRRKKVGGCQQRRP